MFRCANQGKAYTLALTVSKAFYLAYQVSHTTHTDSLSLSHTYTHTHTLSEAPIDKPEENKAPMDERPIDEPEEHTMDILVFTLSPLYL